MLKPVRIPPRPTRPALSFNGLSPLSRQIALFLHGCAGVLKMETVRAVARYSKMEAELPAALAQLADYEVAEPCPFCDYLVSLNTRHQSQCPASVAARKPPKESHA